MAGEEKTRGRARRWSAGALVLLVWMTCAATCSPGDELDAALDEAIARHDLRAVTAPAQPVAKVALGQALFFDRELSGNRDTSCATCHHPAHATVDGRALSSGAGGHGLGPDRTLGPGRQLTSRNAPALFNLGDPAWRGQFWDGRVELLGRREIKSPAHGSLPAGLDNIAAVQAMFPVTSRDEMRGDRGDVDLHGEPNELAEHFDSQWWSIWEGVTARLLAHERYRELFARAYPGTPLDAIGFEHAANAIAAFEIEAFTLADSPWDRYLAGELDAMSDQARRGALLFFGEANCGQCHTGALLTDQRFYNLGVPLVGPGKSPVEPLDYGREHPQMDPAQRSAFRTPPLRNVAHTAPYMHNGAHATLRAAILQHVDPRAAYASYEGGEHLVGAKVWRDERYREEILAGVSPELAVVPALSDPQIEELIAFLGALSSPSLGGLERWVPHEVPSGLPVERPGADAAQ